MPYTTHKSAQIQLSRCLVRLEWSPLVVFQVMTPEVSLTKLKQFFESRFVAMMIIWWKSYSATVMDIQASVGVNLTKNKPGSWASIWCFEDLSNGLTPPSLQFGNMHRQPCVLEFRPVQSLNRSCKNNFNSIYSKEIVLISLFNIVSSLLHFSYFFVICFFIHAMGCQPDFSIALIFLR